MPTTSTFSFGSVSVSTRFSAAVKVVFPDADPPAIPTTRLPARSPDTSEPIPILLPLHSLDFLNLLYNRALGFPSGKLIGRHLGGFENMPMGSSSIGTRANAESIGRVLACTALTALGARL